VLEAVRCCFPSAKFPRACGRTETFSQFIPADLRGIWRKTNFLERSKKHSVQAHRCFAPSHRQAQPGSSVWLATRLLSQARNPAAPSASKPSEPSFVPSEKVELLVWPVLIGSPGSAQA
jgi:hypothetical protein